MSEEKQLSLFELDGKLPTENIEQDNSRTVSPDTQIVPFEIDDRVQVIILPNKMEDVEAYFYLLDFVKKRGLVRKVIKVPSLQYEVEVGNKMAAVYHDEIIAGWPN